MTTLTCRSDKARAMARPMRRAAPVTSAVWPSSDISLPARPPAGRCRSHRQGHPVQGVPSRTVAPRVGGSGARLPDRAALLGRPHHLGSGLARERPLEFRQIRESPDHPILWHGVWILRQCLALRLEAHGIATKLTEGDEESLLGR